jgi:alkanesulfonate monooxygenase SsuD/methylene tetrahydromethanopterin reductase-like flavin-dependent oxidoreductase (luciferase family)
LIDAHFCLEIWGTEYSKIKVICLLADKLGYYGFYYGESLADIDLDCWIIISNLSAVTQMIKLLVILQEQILMQLFIKKEKWN